MQMQESVPQRGRTAEGDTAPTETTGQETLEQYARRWALRMGIVAGVVIALLILLANLDRSMIPMLGDHRAFATLSLYAMIPISIIAGASAYYLGAVAWNVRVPEDRRRPEFWPAIPIGAAYTVLVLFILALVLILVEQAFQDLVLAQLQAALIAGALGAAFTNWIAQQAAVMSVSKLVALTFTVIAIGVYLTAATIDDPLWWQISFSYLGTMKSSSRTIFNIALSFTGLLILVWLPFFMGDLHILVRHGQATPRSIMIYRVALILLAIGVAFVGIFKSGYTPFTSLMHNLSAYSLAGVFGVMMFGLQWLIPGLPREVFVMSWILVGGLVLTLVFAALGYFNTVGLEIVVFVLGLTWLSAFINQVSSLAQQDEPSSFAR